VYAAAWDGVASAGTAGMAARCADTLRRHHVDAKVSDGFVRPKVKLITVSFIHRERSLHVLK
jgi:hypothetical protein